jgi:hypothetical protein
MTFPVILPDRPGRMRLGAIVLPEWLWDEAERQGLDLTGYVKEQRLASYDANIIERRRLLPASPNSLWRL